MMMTIATQTILGSILFKINLSTDGFSSRKFSKKWRRYDALIKKDATLNFNPFPDPIFLKHLQILLKIKILKKENYSKI